MCQVEVSNRFAALADDDAPQIDVDVETEDHPKVDRQGVRQLQKHQKMPRACKNGWKKIEKKEVEVCAVDNGEKQMCLGFQVADVKKPLISVRRIVEKGNHVSFGPAVEDNYIINKKTGDKLMLKPNGNGSYLMEVCFVGGGRTEITVDSGAEENVCPWEWGAQFETRKVGKKMNFRNASGGYVEHYGQRDVLVASPF